MAYNEFVRMSVMLGRSKASLNDHLPNSVDISLWTRHSTTKTLMDALRLIRLPLEDNRLRGNHNRFTSTTCLRTSLLLHIFNLNHAISLRALFCVVLCYELDIIASVYPQEVAEVRTGSLFTCWEVAVFPLICFGDEQGRDCQMVACRT